MSVVVWNVRGLGSLGPCLGCLACVDPNGWGTMLAPGWVIIAMEDFFWRGGAPAVVWRALCLVIFALWRVVDPVARF